MDTTETYMKMCEKAEEIQRGVIPHTAISYLAGLVDGEGTVSIRRKVGNHFNIELYITSTNKSILEWVVKVFGGTIYTYQRKGDTVRLPQQKWHTHGAQAEVILRMIEPYLIIKGEHARLAIGFREKMNRDTSWHREYADKVKSIQKSSTYSEPRHQISQDQLQEMIPLIVEGQTGYPEVSAAVLNKFLTFQWGGFFKSMEQLWLAFVMKERYGKVWSGTDWTKQEVSVGS